MVVLAVETVTRGGSLALLCDGACHAHAGDAARSHGQRLPTDVLALLAAHGRTLHDVDRFAIVAGPGSFTGLRVGMATVQGLALAGRRQVAAVPTLEAMAEAWRLGVAQPAAGPRPQAPEIPEVSGLRLQASEALGARGLGPGADLDQPIVVSCLDGQRGDVFYAAWSHHVECSRVVIGARVGQPDDLIRDLEPHLMGQRAVLVGDGARRYASAFAPLGLSIEEVPMTLAELAARIAARRPDLAAAPLTDSAPAFVISRASAQDDLTDVEGLQRRAFTNPWGAEALRWELAHTDVARLYLMRSPGGALVAYCACWMIFDELHLNSLAVDIEWRRRGLARRLLREVFRDAVAAGGESATLEVRESNAAARALYEGLGFRVEAVRRDYYQGPREDALILWNRSLARSERLC